jgi:hypothetical protein
VAEGVILEFDGIGRAEYEAVNAKLGIDMSAGRGDWPPGLQMHSAGTSDDGKFIVIEVWSSRGEQGAFMQERLGEALAASGVTGRPTVTWVPLIAHHTAIS